MLELIGLETPPQLAGRSLTPALDGAAIAGDVQALAELRTDAATLECIVDDRYKLVRSLLDGAPPALYDMRVDPGETTDVAAGYPEVVARLSSRLKQMVGEARERASAYHHPADLDLPEGVLDQLRALGYVDEGH